MGALQHRIDFVAFISVQNANPNGDPLLGNMPRQDLSGRGEISQECIKRKLRNRLQAMGRKIYLQSEDKRDDEYDSISARVEAACQGVKGKQERIRKICEEFADARAFGGTFAWKGKKDDEDGVSIGITGPVTVWPAKSEHPVLIESMQITKSANTTGSGKRGSDTMGMRHSVEFGLYRLQGSVSAQAACRTGFSEEDAADLKEALSTLFEDDASAARPAGTMEVVRFFWAEHSSASGDCSVGEFFRSVQAKLFGSKGQPNQVSDYEITIDVPAGLHVEDLGR